MLRGIHHLALVTDDKRMTLDFYVRVLGMPIVHGLRTPSRPPSGSRAHGKVRRPTRTEMLSKSTGQKSSLIRTALGPPL
jgi:catechol 2,3-dioxygenase-like lactoylglutathione lyase family enzyme